jgi:methionyl-tRNA synthetase
MNKFYITTAIPYVNAAPHIGHAFEFVQADVITRYNRIIGNKTLLLSGADENALKNVQAAEKENISVQELVNKNSKLFEDLAKKMNVNFDVFQRGSNPQHHLSSQKLWKLCQKDIYKKTYTGLYCIGCEQFYEKEGLNEKGECLEHQGKKLEKISEENYFFKLSKYQKQIVNILESNSLRIVPEHRKNEIFSFVKQGLKDISVSRSNERAKNWGVKVPGDDSQRMYVWFDALNIYRSGIEDKKDQKWWPADLHMMGKGITRFHAVYWPAFLLSAGLGLPKKLFIHDYVMINGQKMSKSTGNVLDPIPLIEKYGADALRYYLLAKISPFTDGDFSEEKFKEVYNADLANGLGNLVARVAKMCEKESLDGIKLNNYFSKTVITHLEEYNFNIALADIWTRIQRLNQLINIREPWKIQNKDELIQLLKDLAKGILEIGFDLRPFLPETAKKIEEQFKGPKIVSSKPLFPRI